MLFVYHPPPVTSEAIFNTVYTKAALLAIEGIAVVTGVVIAVVVVLDIIFKNHFCIIRANVPGAAVEMP